jgi:hypothetical protein
LSRRVRLADDLDRRGGPAGCALRPRSHGSPAARGSRGHTSATRRCATRHDLGPGALARARRLRAARPHQAQHGRGGVLGPCERDFRVLVARGMHPAHRRLASVCGRFASEVGWMVDENLHLTHAFEPGTVASTPSKSHALPPVWRQCCLVLPSDDRCHRSVSPAGLLRSRVSVYRLGS